MKVNTLLKSQPPGYRNRLVDYEMFYLIVISRGRLYYEDTRLKTAIRPGGMAVLRRGSHFELHTRREGYDGIAVSVLPGDEDPFRGESTVLGTTPEISQMATWVAAELKRPQAHSEQVVDGLGRVLLYSALRRLQTHRFGEPGEARRHYWASRAASAISGSLYTDRNIEQILSELEPSHRQIARYMQAEYGRSPKPYQIDLKIREACRLLENTRLSVTTIALELGFPSVQHFSAQFHRLKGRTPTDWKRRR